MINNIELQKSKIIKKRPKRTFSLEDKSRFYYKWKKYRGSLNKFCKENDLVPSAFRNWCKKLSTEQSIKNKDCWIPVITKEQSQKNNYLQVQIDFPNATKILISLLLFFMVLSYAIKVIW